MSENYETKTLFFRKKVHLIKLFPLTRRLQFWQKFWKKIARDPKQFPHHVQKSWKKDNSFEKNDSSKSVPFNTGKTVLKCLPNKHCQKSTKFDPKWPISKKIFMIFFMNFFHLESFLWPRREQFWQPFQLVSTDGKKFPLYVQKS